MIQGIIAIVVSLCAGIVAVAYPLYAFPVIAVVMVNFLIFIAPKYFVLFWLLVAGFSGNIQLPGGISSYGAMNMLFLPSLLFKHLIDLRYKRPGFPLMKSYLFFLAVYFVSIFYSSEPHFMCFRRYLNFIIPFLVTLLVIANFRSRMEIRRFVKITLFVAAVLAFLSTLMFLSGNWKISGDIDRASGIAGAGGHANFYALFLNLHFGVAFTLALFSQSKKDRVLYSIVSLVLCVSLVPTFAKGAYATCVLIVVILSTISAMIRRRPVIMLIPVGFLAICALFGATFFSHTIAYRLSSQETLSWRIELWKNLLQRVAESPFWGHGYLSHFRMAGEALGKPDGFSPHSQYVEILLDTGLLGLAAFILVYSGMFRYALRLFRISSDSYTKSLALGFAVTMGGFLFNSFTESSFFVPMLSLYLWLYFGFLVALSNAEHKEPGYDSRP